MQKSWWFIWRVATSTDLLVCPLLAMRLSLRRALVYMITHISMNIFIRSELSYCIISLTYLFPRISLALLFRPSFTPGSLIRFTLYHWPSQVKLPHDPVCPSSVGRLAGLSVRGGRFHFHAPIWALVLFHLKQDNHIFTTNSAHLWIVRCISSGTQFDAKDFIWREAWRSTWYPIWRKGQYMS